MVPKAIYDQIHNRYDKIISHYTSQGDCQSFLNHDLPGMILYLDVTKISLDSNAFIIETLRDDG